MSTNCYIFCDDEYVRHAFGEEPDATYPMKIRDFWSGWPGSWGPASIDAALYYPGNDKFYIFHGDEYVRHAFDQGPDATYPKSIREVWSGWPGSWRPVRVDAALYYPGNDKFYIFHGDEYVRHSYSHGPDPDYPKKIQGHWSGYPGSWRPVRVEAALYYPGNDKFYIFHGDEYVRHSFGQGPDPAYPKKILGNWRGWPRGVWRDRNMHAALYDSGREEFRLQLVELRCNDAKEYPADEPYIKVNDSTVWGPGSMQTGERRNLHRIEIDFSRTKNAHIELREDDPVGRSTELGHTTIDEREARAYAAEGRDRTKTFRRDRHMVGDASYTLTYRVVVE